MDPYRTEDEPKQLKEHYSLFNLIKLGFKDSVIAAYLFICSVLITLPKIILGFISKKYVVFTRTFIVFIIGVIFCCLVGLPVFGLLFLIDANMVAVTLVATTVIGICVWFVVMHATDTYKYTNHEEYKEKNTINSFISGENKIIRNENGSIHWF